MFLHCIIFDARITDISHSFLTSNFMDFLTQKIAMRLSYSHLLGYFYSNMNFFHSNEMENGIITRHQVFASIELFGYLLDKIKLLLLCAPLPLFFFIKSEAEKWRFSPFGSPDDLAVFCPFKKSKT